MAVCTALVPSPYNVLPGGQSGSVACNGCANFTWTHTGGGPCTLKFYDAGGAHLGTVGPVNIPPHTPPVVNSGA